ncbi:cation diffusion facilitator family transporter [Tomitella biformata]|uniref:cation diffusion facilitator family transporter n=1 Tax=Tomitella biformata TaxID=630403 RepID=UPI00046546C5|nr:cation diffusion facilitator family transporter [Tomitella biformata]
MSSTHNHAAVQDSHAHSHTISADADRRYLWIALALLLALMAGEIVVGIMAGSLALLADAAHMVSDAGAIALSLFAMAMAARPATGSYTFGFKRAEILSALLNGATLLVLAVYFTFESIRRLLNPGEVDGALVFIVAMVGVAVNLLATWVLSKANRQSLNVEGSYQHILTDLYAFIGTAVAGAVIYLTGFVRADAIASLLVAALMFKAGYSLVREGGRVVLEAAPRGIDPLVVSAEIAATATVVEVHDLHIWEVTSGFPSLSAHVIVEDDAPCHAVRGQLEEMLHERFEITHTTLQVDHAAMSGEHDARSRDDCPERVLGDR